MVALRWQGIVELALFLFAVAVLTVLVQGCKPSVAKPAAYGVELEECSRNAKTCEESVSCENQVRARYGRPLRTGGCK
jgi:hypothetical protein